MNRPVLLSLCVPPFEHATHVTYVIVDRRLAVDQLKRKPIPIAERRFYNTPWIPC